MSKWIDADALIDAHYQYCCEHDYEGAVFEAWSRDLMENAPSIDLVRCKDCKHWIDERVLMDDGRMRQYTESDVDALGIKNSVSISEGINGGAMCLYEENRGWETDHTTFRNADDYCSRGEFRPCSYEKWWGIEDGIYAGRWKEDT